MLKIIITKKLLTIYQNYIIVTLQTKKSQQRACDKYQGRFRRVADAADRPLNAYTEAEKIALWEQAKEN